LAELKVELNNGTNFIIEIENYDPVELEDKLNNHEKYLVALGNAIVQKHSIVSIMPVGVVNE